MMKNFSLLICMFLCALSLFAKSQIAVKHDPDAAEVFLTLEGHWVFHNPKARFVVYSLTSVGCPGCLAFVLKGQAMFVKRFGKIASFRDIDYFLTKKDLTAMAMISVLPKKLQDTVRPYMLEQQNRWGAEGVSTLEFMTKFLEASGFTLSAEYYNKIEEARVSQLQQRQGLDMIYTIQYLPFFLVMDSLTNELHIVDTLTNLTSFLEDQLEAQEKLENTRQKNLNKRRKQKNAKLRCDG
ncbi:MAG: hypothetical protein OXC30_05970 [Alphaproteobacteria bacterium]|nr:hypothetical protein [Alphaproteobacteria bacterium]